MVEKSLQAWLAYISEQHWQSMDLGLSRMQKMLARMQLSAPHRAGGKVVTIAGTNGKGSTAVALERILLDAGLVVGSTLSPHIQHFNERIRVAGDALPDQAICAAFAAVEAHRDGLPLTYFEYSALAALWSFQRAEVDVAILEIGLGGRLDAFNVIDADLAIITSIALDHQEFLGDTLDLIGREKAGILRRGQTLVTGPDMPASISDICADLDISPLVYGRDFLAEPVPENSASGPVRWRFLQRQAHAMVLQHELAIAHLAAQNVAVALAAAQALVACSPTLQVALPLALDGVSEMAFAGRLQLGRKFKRRWVLDVAHNPAGVKFLAEQLRHRRLTPKVIVCGMLRDKDHAGVAALLQELYTPSWIFFATQGARGVSAQQQVSNFAAHADSQPASSAQCASSAEQALQMAVSASADGDVILVLGSFNAVEQFTSLTV